MVNKLYRAQILLEPDQHQNLSDLARREGVSVSEMVREIIADYLVEQNEKKAERLKAWQCERQFIDQQPAVEGETPAVRTWRREDLYDR